MVAEAERPPVDQIRQAEAQVTRRIAAARRVADQALANAQSQAADLKRQALQAGRRDGKARHQEIMSQAEEEARAILAQARSQAQQLCQDGTRRMDDAVGHAVAIILGQDAETDRA